jgi:hypothetical protein
MTDADRRAARRAALYALERIPDPADLRTPAGVPRGTVPRLEGKPDRWIRWWLQPIKYANWRHVERSRGIV